MTQQLARLNLIFLLGSAAVIAIVVLGLRAPLWVAVIIAAAAAVANIAAMLTVLRRGRAAVQAIAAAHPGALTLATAVTAWSSADRSARARVVALVADRAGISLRDAHDGEVGQLPADRILSIELGPLGRTAYRPFRIETLDDGVVELAMGQVRPDDQVDAVVALRTALGRPAG